MKMIVLKSDRKIFSGDVEFVTLPGKKGFFTLESKHAPLISVLIKGEIKYRKKKTEEHESIAIEGGFATMKDDLITVCLD